MINHFFKLVSFKNFPFIYKKLKLEKSEKLEYKFILEKTFLIELWS